MTTSGVPWCELFRPKKFEEIVLDPLNKQILTNIIDTNYFPNLLFFGPPGTGKTTTIINLINSYQERNGYKNKELIIHLNASDERGIDIIRNQISAFVNSKPLFNTGMKFVILDEVDYMTKNAQQALKYLLQIYSNSVRFCLICNYISRIDEGLQNEFLRLRFNQLPKKDIYQFLKNISDFENLNLDEKSINNIQELYNSDIRSMVNFMQSNQDIINFKKERIVNIIDNSIWENIIKKFENNEKHDLISKYIHEISINYNIDKKNLIKDFLNYIIRNKHEFLTHEFLNFIENLIHNPDCNNKIYINYFINKLSNLLKKNNI
jgi:DNA polymerase III delta prime subunit